MLDGLITKGIGGFYYVQTDEGMFETKPRGIFRKEKIKPLAGDRCKISKTGDMVGVIEEIKERKNSFIRPPVANLDQLYFVVSSTSPEPNMDVLDRLIITAEYKDIKPYIIFTKQDIKETTDIMNLYESIGYTCFSVDYTDKSVPKEIYKTMIGKISAFSGNTGVGKSTLINEIIPELSIETGETSEKLGRGKHTTRDVNLYPLKDGGYIADTPGFSTIDITQLDTIDPSELGNCYIEMREFIPKCKFNDCLHTVETGCAVLKAVEEGKISEQRHKTYISILGDLQKADRDKY